MSWTIAETSWGRDLPTPTVQRQVPLEEDPLAPEGNVVSTIFDAGGREVRRLLQDHLPGHQIHTVTWDGQADSGGPAPAGVYFLRLVGPKATTQTKLIVVR